MDAITVDPYEPTFPRTFSIGRKQTGGPLVDIPQLKSHLAVLNAFVELKERVDSDSGSNHGLERPGQVLEWPSFVGLAVERFDKWVKSLEIDDYEIALEDILPPNDVLMVWHSYMLNPRWYAEDGLRLEICRPLVRIGMKLEDEFERLTLIVNSEPTQARVLRFEERVSLPFDPTESMQIMRGTTIQCPRCRYQKITVPYFSPDGTGYLQSDFRTECPGPSCQQFGITKEMLCAEKLAESLSRFGMTPDTFLPGTWLSESPQASRLMGLKIIKTIRRAYGVSPTELTAITFESRPTVRAVNSKLRRKLLDDTNYSLSGLKELLGKSKSLGRIMSAHSTPKAYSVDLVGAVLRQGDFIDKIAKLGWTRPGYTDSPRITPTLMNAVARYHAFLDLLSTGSESLLVPTLDIDLVWHTHQLMPEKYHNDCMNSLGRFIDHDDKVDIVSLSTAFDETYKAWTSRFGVSYTCCGCPPPSQDSLSERIKKGLPSKAQSNTILLDAIQDTAMTHASDHNGVQFTSSQNKKTSKAARKKYEEHQVKVEKRSTKRNTLTSSDDEAETKCPHDSPFLSGPPSLSGSAEENGSGGCALLHKIIDSDACGCTNGTDIGGGCSTSGWGWGTGSWGPDVGFGTSSPNDDIFGLKALNNGAKEWAGDDWAGDGKKWWGRRLRDLNRLL
ncbi:hypothetical protein H1R20_g15175, partial [Candolleomyces eurysporus]